MRTISPLCFLLLLMTSCNSSISSPQAFQTQVMETAVSAAWTEVIETQTAKTQIAPSPTATPDPVIISPQNASQLVLRSMNMGSTAENTAYSPDGKWLYMPSNTGMYVYDTTSYKSVYLVSDSPFGTFSPSGKILMRYHELFLTEGMQKLPALEFFPLITNPYASYRTFFSPDESLTARDFSISQDDASHVVKVWRLSDGKLINTFEAGDVAISTDNRLIAIGRSEQDHLSQAVQPIAYLYDLQTGEELGHWQGGRPVFLSDNSLVLEANGYTRIFDPGKHKSRRVFAGTQAVFSSDERSVALWERSYINVYQVSDGQLLSRFKLELSRIDEITLRFSPDGQVLAGYTWRRECCSGYTANLSLWRVSDGALIKKLRPSRNFVFSPDSQTIVAGGREVLRTSDGSLIADLQQTCEISVTNLIFISDGQQVIVDCYVLYLYSVNGRSPWAPQKVDRETYLPILKAASPSNWREVPSPDGKFLARKVSSLIVVSSISGEEKEFYIPGEKVTRFAFSPDHQILALGLSDGSVDLWDVNMQRSVYTIPPQILTLDSNSVNGLAFSPDGKSLVISVSDGTMRLYGINAR